MSFTSFYRNKITLIELIKSNRAKKAIEFLENLSNNLKKVKFEITDGFDISYNNSKYYFYAGIFTVFHLVSWFVKGLRYSKKDQNKFDIKILISSFPFLFLEKKASCNDNYNFVINLWNLLQEENKIQIIDLELSFINFNLLELDEILNLSFENLVFGVNFNTDKLILIEDKIDLSILGNSLISKDYIVYY